MIRGNYLETPLWNADLTEEERLSYLVGELTLEEKIRCMGTGNIEILRLGIPKFSVGGEGAHGVQARHDQSGDTAVPVPTTILPNPIGMSATWDEELIKEAGAMVGNEARGLYQSGRHASLCLWAPTVDMERDPRWGRTEEGYGEDPYLTSKMAGAYIDGIRGEDENFWQCGATLKHFYANNVEQGRTYISSTIDLRNKYEYYLEPFRRLAREHHAVGMMTAYNEVNGIPAMLLQQEIAQMKECGIGHVVCDGGDVSQTVVYHKYFSRHSETIAAGLEAQVDCFTDDSFLVAEAVQEAYDCGMITEKQIDAALKNYFCILLRLGFFDKDGKNPYAKVGREAVGTKKNQELARKVTSESVVLLKNNGILPLCAENFQNGKEKLAVIGPVCDVWFKDWYSGIPPYFVTPAQGIREAAGDHVLTEEGVSLVKISFCGKGFLGIRKDGSAVLADEKEAEIFRIDFWGENRITLRAMGSGMLLTTQDDAQEGEKGQITATKEEAFGWFVKEIFYFEEDCLLTWDKQPLYFAEDGRLYKTDSAANPMRIEIHYQKEGIHAAQETAKKADTVLLFLGPNPMINCKEEIDRETIALPPYQEELLNRVSAVNPNVILVLVSSIPFALPQERKRLAGILVCATGSMELGHGMADVIFGKESPAGRLNMTWYASDADLPPLNDYDIIQGHRTYQYFDGKVLYPFGHGLTYSEIQYRNLQICSQNEKTVTLALEITNIGSRRTDEVVQIYMCKENSEICRAHKKLVAFRREKDLRAGENRTIFLELALEDFKYYDVIAEQMLIEPGEYQIMAGASSENILQRTVIFLEGTKRPCRDGSRKNKAECFAFARNYVLQPGHIHYTAVCTQNETDVLELVYDKVSLKEQPAECVLDFWKEYECSILLEANGVQIGRWHLESPLPEQQKSVEAGQADGNGAFEAHQNWLLKRREIGYTEICIPVSHVPVGEEFTLTIKWQGRGKLCMYYFR